MSIMRGIDHPCMCGESCGRIVTATKARALYLHEVCRTRRYQRAKRGFGRRAPFRRLTDTSDLEPAEIDQLFLAHLASVKADRKFTLDPWATSYALQPDPGEYPSHKEIRAVSTPEQDWKMASKRKKRKT